MPTRTFSKASSSSWITVTHSSLSGASTAVDEAEQTLRLQRTSTKDDGIPNYDDKKEPPKLEMPKPKLSYARLRTLSQRFGTMRLYYKAVLWSLLMALPVVLVGFSQNLVVSLLAQPQFQYRFSSDEEDFGAAWMLGVQMCSVGSSMVGGMTIG